VNSYIPEEQNTCRPTDLKVSHDVSEFSTVFYAFEQGILPLPPPVNLHPKITAFSELCDTCLTLVHDYVTTRAGRDNWWVFHGRFLWLPGRASPCVRTHASVAHRGRDQNNDFDRVVKSKFNVIIGRPPTTKTPGLKTRVQTDSSMITSRSSMYMFRQNITTPSLTALIEHLQPTFSPTS
jgi:hypothetical protein